MFTVRRAPTLLFAVLLLAVSPVGAQSADEARVQRESNRLEQARVARDLDVAGAEVSEIRAALEGLDQSLAFQQAEIDRATQALAAATASAQAHQRSVEETSVRVSEVRVRVQSSVVDAYTGGFGATEDWMGSADLAEATQRQELLRVVRGRFADDLDVLRGLVEQQERATEQARLAMVDIAAAGAVLDAGRRELQAQRDTEARLEEGLRAKVGDFEGQAAQLRAAEQELTDVITAHDRAAAAAAAAASSVAAAARATRVVDDVPNLSPARVSGGGFLIPASGPVTSHFGYRRHPILGSVRLHAGTDIGSPYGAAIWASKAGEVIFAGWNGGYGNCVIISHGGGLSTLYAHQSELNVGEGDSVSQGDVIGWVGSTGQSTGAHLHFEVRVGGTPEDPMNYL